MADSEQQQAQQTTNGDVPQQQEKVAAATPAHKIRHEWYQTDSTVVLDVFIKNVDSNSLSVQLTDRSVSLTIPLSNTSTHLSFDLDPLVRSIDPSKSTHKVFGTKISLTLAKVEQGAKWSKLEGDDESGSVGGVINSSSSTTKTGPSYPTSSRRKTDWDSLALSAVKSEKADEEAAWKLPNSGGDASANKAMAALFQGATEEQQRAMMKSYTESGGTTLSTNWEEVGRRRTEIRPPEGLIARKWEK